MKQGFGYCRGKLCWAAYGRDGIPRLSTPFESSDGSWIRSMGRSDLEHRPALQQLLDAANGVKRIVIEKVDRLARDLMIQESIIADLKKKEFEVIGTLEPDLCRLLRSY